MPQSLIALVVTGSIFGLIAGIMAAIILYTEWRRHRLGGNRAWKVAVLGGVVAFAVFMIMSVLWVYIARDLIQ